MARKKDDNEIEEKQVDTLEGKTFFKSSIAGLSVHLSSNTDRTEVGVDAVRFLPYKYKDEKTGDDVKFGLLAVDDSDTIEALEETAEVEELDRSEYEALLEKSTRVPY